MGITHHWKRPVELPPEAFKAAIIDSGRLLSDAEGVLAGFDGTGSPLVEDEHLVLNGRGTAGVEPLELVLTEFDRHGRTEVWGHCKTGLRPYDLHVKAVLIIFRHHLPGLFSVMSDQTDTEWETARKLTNRLLGYGRLFTLDRDPE